ncbi:MAG: hypothetical protein M3Z26_15280 [Bacteroidota bacterium]|nr:hypothetical protein [Bacteroidota bacterium]
MKAQSNNLLETLTYEEIKILTDEVKETLFLNFKKRIPRNFAASQMWKIQRQRKQISARKFYA